MAHTGECADIDVLEFVRVIVFVHKQQQIGGRNCCDKPCKCAVSLIPIAKTCSCATDTFRKELIRS